MPAPTVALLMLASIILGAAIGPGVRAAFVSSASASTGTFSFARLTASFATGTDDLGAPGGVGGSSYTMTIASLALGVSVHRYTSLTNTGSVTASIQGTVSGTPVGGLTVAVDACSQAWSAGLCAGTTTSLRSATSLTAAPSVSYGSLAVNGVTYLRYTFTATTTLASATAIASAVVTGTGGNNRTSG